MNVQPNVLAQAPNVRRWPWKAARPESFWRVHIGQRIRERREQLPSDTPSDSHSVLTREALARHLGIPALNVWEMENGIIGVDAALLPRLAEALHVHPGWFFDLDPLPQWIATVEKSRFLHRMSALLAPLTQGEFDLLETVLRYLAQRRTTSMA